MTRLPTRPGEHPDPRPARAADAQPSGAVDGPMSAEDIFALVHGTVAPLPTDHPSEPVEVDTEGLTGEALMNALLDAELGARDVDRPTTSVFGDTNALDREVTTDLEQQAIRARRDADRAAREAARHRAEEEERIGRRHSRGRVITWVAASVAVCALVGMLLLALLDPTRSGSTDAPTSPAPAPTERAYQVDPGVVTGEG